MSWSCVYIYTRKRGKVKRTSQIDGRVFIDYDKEGRMLGVEIVGALKIAENGKLIDRRSK